MRKDLVIIMATTGIWKVNSNLKRVLQYTTNVEKTKNEKYDNCSYHDLHNLLDYVESDFKTEEQFFVSGINCSAKTALDEMVLTKEQFGKKNGIQAFHAFQSFKEGEVTPEQCHEIGVKLANEMWGDRFEVVVSTHVNTNHLHNHFVINSVSFKDGKRYYDNRKTYAELRRLSDAICAEYGLNVLEEKECKRSHINYANYQMGENQKETYYTIAKDDLNRAIGMAYSYEDFEDLMKAMDYELIYRANKLSIRREPYKKNIRIERYFGTEFSIERIKERIEEEHIVRIPFIEEYGIPKKASFIKRKKPKGLYSLFIHYCYLLKVFPKKYPYQKLTPEIRADIKIIDELSNQTQLLVSNHLDTDEQFFLFKEEKEKQLKQLMDKREKMWYRHKKESNETEKRNCLKEINQLNKQINPLREEVKLCKSILERSEKIQDNLQQLVEEKGKERNENEWTR